MDVIARVAPSGPLGCSWVTREGSCGAGLTVRVLAKPRARQERLSRAADGSLVARVSAPPADGQANRSIRILLARALGLRQGDVMITGGHGSRTKRVELHCRDRRALAARLELLEAEA